MKTNFFSRVEALQLSGDMVLTLKKNGDGQWVVSIRLHNRECGDSAQNLIPPLVLKNTAKELDAGFFQTIAQPLQQTSDLSVQMESYLRQQQKAKEASEMAKDKERKFKQAMEKVDALEKEKKFREAYCKMPAVSDFPDFENDIRNRKRKLSEKFAPDLFESPETTGQDNKNDKPKNSK
ncbi:PRTRC system protein E [Sinomicrobium oceani]|uniref:PRTRC system protein E n=1 Tax=Sinomicrobium oceani TaxID=1150368 RepID=UPI00227C0376|nr:PRTRC system protein E [Sinomicrobium oceani]